MKLVVSEIVVVQTVFIITVIFLQYLFTEFEIRRFVTYHLCGTRDAEAIVDTPTVPDDVIVVTRSQRTGKIAQRQRDLVAAMVNLVQGNTDVRHPGGVVDRVLAKPLERLCLR